MEKEPKLEKSQIPFDIDGLLDSDISITHEKNSKFFETKNEPDKVIRIENLEELKSKHKNKFELIELVEIAKKLFRELEEKYSILAPVNIFLFKDKNDKEVVCSVVDKISGEHLGKVEKSDETISKIKTLYTSVARYFLDKSKEGGLYLWDISGESQYIYGKKSGDNEDSIYLIDTDIWLNNSRTGIYLVVYWLTRHISERENDLGIQFNEARNYIKQFINQSLPENMSDDDMKNANGIKSFLNNEKSDYNPKSAIPKFE